MTFSYWCRPRRPQTLITRVIVIVILLLFLFSIFHNNTNNPISLESLKQSHKKIVNLDKKHVRQHSLCILIPFRDRFEELLEFVPRITKFLERQNVEHKIFIINQVDEYRFNRASLLNVGFQETKSAGCDYIALHDVDLIPRNDNLLYAFPEKGPFHISAPCLHPKYDYPTFLGGIMLISRKHFQLLNGMSNRYWGWGMEDDEFGFRIKEAKLEVHRPSLDVITTRKKDTFYHHHSKVKRKRDQEVCYDQWIVTRKRDRETGLDTLDYNLLNTRQLTIEEIPITTINVALECDKSKTPWCDCSNASASEKGKRPKLPRDGDVIIPKVPRNVKC